jgi:carbonic anhydrase/acetyltransferase-like protein (isoleucine patch superfamily)
LLRPDRRDAVNLRRLKYFVKIVDMGSLTQAADILHIAQPALSQQIASLGGEVFLNSLIIGDDVTIGHNVVLHGCTIGSRVLIGIGANRQRKSIRFVRAGVGDV